MTTYLITRHPGAIEWAKAVGVEYDLHTEHLLDMCNFVEGDVVIGTLPINMVYELNCHGVRYKHLSLNIPPHLRGHELSIEQLEECGACLEEYYVNRM